MLCVVHYKDIFFLQVFIGVLFLVSFAEMAIWYGEYTFGNVTGQTSLFLVITGVLTSTIKSEFSLESFVAFFFKKFLRVKKRFLALWCW